MNRKDRTHLKWNGWGWRGRQAALAEAPGFWRFVRDWLGVDALPPAPSVTWEEIDVPPGRFSETERRALADIVGAAQVRTGDYERLFHAMGRSYHDLLRLRAGRIEGFPDAVCYPASHAHVAQLIDWAGTSGCALVPFGGGSSVVGGVESVTADRPDAGRRVLTLDTSRMDRLLAFDAQAGTATFEAGIYGPALEAALAEQTLSAGRPATLGHFPQSFEFSTLGGWIAARSAGQSSDRYGKIEDLLVSARLATPAGPWTTTDAPASAAGPDLNQLVAGSEGSLGVITEATVRVRPRPATRQAWALLFETFDAGLDAARRLRRAEDLPLESVRLSDADETALFRQVARLESGAPDGVLKRGFKKGLQHTVGKEPALMRVALAGGRWAVAQGLARAGALCLKAGGVPLGPWRGGRDDHYAMPYLRDALMDRGVGVDTLETAAPWPRLCALRRDVRAALQQAAGGHPCIVMTHLSHSYATGASLYFTLIFPMDCAAPVEQWHRLKKAASDAIVAGGGTISHHHGVGRDHLPWMPAEKGTVGLSALQGAKAHLDPDGMMNPGKLLPSLARVEEKSRP